MAAPSEKDVESLDFRRNNAVEEQQHNPFAHGQKHPRFSFSSDEMRTLKECNRESFYQRSLPFSAAAMFAAHFAVKAGYLSASPKYGSLWKVVVAGSVGYFMGKVSYRRKCMEKFMRLPNSKIGEALRRRGLRTDQDAYAFEQSFFGGVSEPSSGPLLDRESDTDVGSGSWDIDDDKNIKFHGLDESQRPSLDSEYVPSLPNEEEERKPQVFTSYEALRQQNRDEYEMRRLNVLSKKDSSPSRKAPTEAAKSSSALDTNKYGDRLD